MFRNPAGPLALLLTVIPLTAAASARETAFAPGAATVASPASGVVREAGSGALPGGDITGRYPTLAMLDPAYRPRVGDAAAPPAPVDLISESAQGRFTDRRLHAVIAPRHETFALVLALLGLFGLIARRGALR